MSRIFVTSAPIERSFMRDRRWQNPGRREHLFGRVQGLSDIRRPAFINKIALVLKGRPA